MGVFFGHDEDRVEDGRPTAGHAEPGCQCVRGLYLCSDGMHLVQATNVRCPLNTACAASSHRRRVVANAIIEKRSQLFDVFRRVLGGTEGQRWPYAVALARWRDTCLLAVLPVRQERCALLNVLRVGVALIARAPVCFTSYLQFVAQAVEVTAVPGHRRLIRVTTIGIWGFFGEVA